MTRIIPISTLALTWLLMVALPVGAGVEARLPDVVVYGLPPVPAVDAAEPPVAAIAGADA